MSKSFKEKVYGELRNEFDGYSYAVGRDKKGFLIGVATNEKELKTLLNKKGLSVVSAYEMSEICINYLVDKEKISKNKGIILMESQVKEYALNQLYKSSSSSSVELLEKEMLYNNRFTYNLNDFFSSRGVHCDLDSIYLPDNKDGRLPMFRMLHLMKGMFHVFVTGSQMALVTPTELIKIHNAESDIELEDLADLLVSMFSVNKDELMSVLQLSE